MIYTGLLSLLLAEYAANQKCSAVLLCSADSIYPQKTGERDEKLRVKWLYIFIYIFLDDRGTLMFQCFVPPVWKML